MFKKVFAYLTLFVLLGGLLVGCGGEAEPTAAPTEPVAEPTEPTEPEGEAGRLILATTTSTQDSGLLDAIIPDFEAQYDANVEVVAVGTGQALALGRDGNADVLLVHARAREDEFMAEGHGVRREDVMYNDFVIVGPPDDPAGIAGMTDAPAAFQAIAEAGAPFVSRGDDSGTHTKERAIWQEASIEPSGDWYISAGQGMGAVLTMADEQQAYTLSDRATYLARTLEGTELEILVEGDPILFNPYGVIAVNPDKGPHIQNELANTFIDWLIAVPTQEMIAEFGIDQFGTPLFTPDSDAWRAAQGEGETGGEDVMLRIHGNVASAVGWSEEELRGMETVTVEDATGVPLNTLLELASLNAEATTLVFVAGDGYSAEADLAEVQACADCIVAFDDDGAFDLVMPGFPGGVQVRDVIEIQVD